MRGTEDEEKQYIIMVWTRAEKGSIEKRVKGTEGDENVYSCGLNSCRKTKNSIKKREKWTVGIDKQ